MGWSKDACGKDIFRAIVDFPEGPPPDITFDVVWRQLPVTIALAKESATPIPVGKDTVTK